MKKVKIFFVLVGMILLMSGCGNETVQPNAESPQSTTEPETVPVVNEVDTEGDMEVVEKEDAPKRVIGATEISEDILSWHKVSDTVCDVDGDGESDDEVVLATTAECNAQHEFIWNDGQNWALYVISDSETYLLFNEYINAGYPYFEVAEYYMENEVQPRVNVVISAGASFSLRSYLYSESDKGYVEETIYHTNDNTAGGINTVFSSFPEYKAEVKSLK